MLRLAAAALCCVLVASCAQPPQGPARAAALPSPAPRGSSQPHLTSDGERVYLSWLQERDDSTSLRVATHDGKSWSESATVVSDLPLLVNWADFPALMVTDEGALAAQWLVRGAGESFTYDAFIGVSMDGGESWSQALRVHDAGVASEYGFVSLIDEPDGSIGMVWLDGRELERSGKMQLRYRRWRDGRLEAESLLDDDVCTCCQTSATLAGDDLLVAYRDRLDGEIRDISLLRRRGREWTESRTLHDDGWYIAGCPVNGPSVVASGETVALAWFTAAGERPRVLLAFSLDGGASFSEPVTVDAEHPLGRVDLVSLEDGSVALTWLARSAEAAEVRLRRYHPDGTVGTLRNVGAASPGRRTGFPRSARLGSSVYVAWTEPGPPPKLRLAVLEP